MRLLSRILCNNELRNGNKRLVNDKLSSIHLSLFNSFILFYVYFLFIPNENNIALYTKSLLTRNYRIT